MVFCSAGSLLCSRCGPRRAGRASGSCWSRTSRPGFSPAGAGFSSRATSTTAPRCVSTGGRASPAWGACPIWCERGEPSSCCASRGARAASSWREGRVRLGPPMIGEQFGNYRSLALLGEGGMGAVYLAEHPGIGRRVAVKVLHKNYTRDEHLLARFLNEARAANAIRHPNIIEILDSGTLADGTPFLVMELLEGESLGARLRNGGVMPIATALDFAYQTASALGAAHV